MVMIRKSTSLFLGAVALAGAALSLVGDAAAGPGPGHIAHPGHHGHHGHGMHRPHHRPHHVWRGHYGPRFVGVYDGGYRCRFVRRVNAYGELVVRRVCFNPYY
jgi:hypothetical protein